MFDFLKRKRGKEKIVKRETEEEIRARAENIIQDIEQGGLPFNLAYPGNSPIVLGFRKKDGVFVVYSSHEVITREEALGSVIGSLQLGGF